MAQELAWCIRQWHGWRKSYTIRLYRGQHAMAQTCFWPASGEHDAQVPDVIAFSGRIGVHSVNKAHRLQGVHTWNLAGHSGGIGILLNAAPWGGTAGGRVQNCYLDFAQLIMVNSGNKLVTDNLFPGTSSIVLATRSTQKLPHGVVRNLIITSNVFHSRSHGNTSVLTDITAGPFKRSHDVLIENNGVDAKFAMNPGCTGKRGSRATISTVMLPDTVNTAIWFGDYLVFNTTINPSCVQRWLTGTFATAVSGQVNFKHAVDITLGASVPKGGGGNFSCSL